jgi:UDP-N-acetylmuramyl pentapeptide synthase
LTFGTSEGCDYRASEIVFKDNGWDFLLNDIYPFRVNALSKSCVSNALAAIACGFLFDLDYLSIHKRLAGFRPLYMRMQEKEIAGVLVIDDTYNSSPLSCESAIETLSRYRAPGKKIFVTADMLELGKMSEALHKRLGKIIAEADIDILVTMGKLSVSTFESAIDCGMRKEKVFCCDSADSVARLLKQITAKGDVVLVKGSRGMKMEEVISCFTTFYTR